MIAFYRRIKEDSFSGAFYQTHKLVIPQIRKRHNPLVYTSGKYDRWAVYSEGQAVEGGKKGNLHGGLWWPTIGTRNEWWEMAGREDVGGHCFLKTPTDSVTVFRRRMACVNCKWHETTS